MRGIEFITGHMVYNPAYTEILQTKAPIAPLNATTEGTLLELQ